MRSFTNRSILFKMRRLFEFFIVTLFIVMMLTIASKWSPSKSKFQPKLVNDNIQHLNMKVNPIPVNPLAPQAQSLNVNDDNLMIKQPLLKGADLVKYIHLDLKGAPPQADKFYENFFDFVDKLQMGVKGVVIEYEDILPLEGRFANVRLKQVFLFELKLNMF